MASKMDISIAMATYCGEAFIAAQLQSLFSQLVPPFEIVICDDSPNDDTGRLVRRLRGQSPCPVHYSRNEHQLGVTKNFERAVSLCRGDLIFLCDQDDVWHPHKLDEFSRYFEMHPETGAAICNASVVGPTLEPLGYSLWEMLWFTRAEQRSIREGRPLEVFLKHVVASGNSMAFRSSYKGLVLPFPDLYSCHDAWTACLIGSVSGFGLIDQELLSYRIHDANAVGIGRPSLRDQLAMARKQIRDGLFDYAESLHRAMLDRLRTHETYRNEVDPMTLACLEEKIAHAQVRSDMSTSMFRRLPTIYREWQRGNYLKYAYGLKSVAQDLFLR